MSEAGQNLLNQLTRDRGIIIEPSIQRFALLFQLLTRTNQTTNLTAIRDEIGIIVRHFLDSLTCLLADPMEGQQGLIDIGAGPGFPGLPLIIARPQLKVTLLESNQKKVAFIEQAIHSLNPDHATVVWGRAEEVAHQPQFREQFDLATARALSSLPTVCELCLPFLKVGGKLIAMKGPEVEAELEAGEKAANLLGGTIRQDISLELPHNAGPRRLIVVEKTEPTPKNYPRRAGIPERKPLR